MQQRRFQDKYPNYPPEAYADMDRLHSGPLPKTKQVEALKLYAQGFSRDEITKKLGISNGSLQISAKYDADFKTKWNKLRSQRPRQVSDKMLTILLKGSVEYRTKWLPTLDSDGKPLYINGHQKFYIASREKIRKPPSDALLQFFLKATDPQFGAPEEGEENVPLETLREQVAAKLKVIQDDKAG